MSRPPARAVVMSSALALTALLTVTACSADGSGAAATASPGAATSPAPAGAPPLTAAQAQAALVTADDLGEPWIPTQGAANPALTIMALAARCADHLASRTPKEAA